MAGARLDDAQPHDGWAAAAVPVGPVTPAAPVVRCQLAGRRFDDVVALADIDLAVHPSELMWLIGPSGSGKSTLLRVLSGHLFPTTGRVLGDDGPLRGRRMRHWRSRVGFVHQNHGLLADRTAAENVAFALEPLGWKARVVRERVGELLESVGLAATADRYPRQLSAGECQRIALARALAPRPVLLACDEPTGNLDPDNGDAVLQLLVAATRTGAAVVIASHDARLVDAIRGRVVELRGGRIVRDEAMGGYRRTARSGPHTRQSVIAASAIAPVPVSGSVPVSGPVPVPVPLPVPVSRVRPRPLAAEAG